jgi:(2Fe-2S) ferredoxin
MPTQTIIEHVRRDGILYRIDHTMVESIVDEKAEKEAAIDKEIADHRKRIVELEAEKAAVASEAGKQG